MDLPPPKENLPLATPLSLSISQHLTTIVIAPANAVANLRNLFQVID